MATPQKLKIFTLVPVVEDLQETITSIACHEDQFFLGTSSGCILKFSISSSIFSEEVVNSGTFVSRLRVANRKRVESFQVLPSGDLMYLVDTALQAISTSFSEQHPRNIVPRGVFSFCLQVADSSVMEMCVAIRKRLVFFSIHAINYVVKKDLSVPDDVFAMCWCKKWICVGFKKEYALINENDGTILEIFPLDNSIKCLPRIFLLPDDEIMLIGQDCLGIFFNLNNQQPSQKDPIQWPKNLLKVGVYGAYVTGVTTSGTIGVYSIRDQKLCQRLQVTSISAMCCDSRRILFASTSGISCLLPIPYKSQMHKLLLETRISDALELLNSNFGPEDLRRVEELGTFYLLSGWVLFNDLKFPGAFQHFAYAKFDVSILLAFWETYLPTWWDFEAASERASKKFDPQSLQLIPTPEDIHRFIKSRLQARRHMSSEETNIFEVPGKLASSGNTDVKADLGSKDIAMDENSERFNATSVSSLLEIANSSLATFLLRERFALISGYTDRLASLRDFISIAGQEIQEDKAGRMMRNSDVQDRDVLLDDQERFLLVLRLIDTIVFKLLVECDDPRWKDMIEDARAPLACRVADCSDFLTNLNRYDALAMLMMRHNQYSDAMDTWMGVLNGVLGPPVDSNLMTRCDPEKMMAEILVLFSDKPEAIEMFQIYSRVLVAKKSEYSLKIFTSGQNLCCLSPDEIIEILSKNTDNQTLIRSYLEHLVYRQKFAEPSERTRLALLYLREVMATQSEVPPYTQRIPPGFEPQPLGGLRAKLINYLENEDGYDKRRVLHQIEGTWLLEEKVILLGKLGNYRDALKLLVANLRDISKAEAYCHAINAHLKFKVDNLTWEEYQKFLSFMETDSSASAEEIFSEMMEYLDASSSKSALRNSSNGNALEVFSYDNSIAPPVMYSVSPSPWESFSKSWYPQKKFPARVVNASCLDPQDPFKVSDNSFSDAEDEELFPDGEADSIENIHFRMVISNRSFGMMFTLFQLLVKSWSIADSRAEKGFFRANALYLLNKYSIHPDLNPLRVTACIPDSWPLEELSNYYFSCHRNELHMSTQTSIQENLLSMSYLTNFSDWSDEMGKYIAITNESICAICLKHIGDQSFAAYPSGACVHEQCVTNRKVDHTTDADCGA